MTSVGTSFPSVFTQQDEVPEDIEAEEECILIGSGEYLLVGIRFYVGTAHPGEFVTLVREPFNPYDRFAIRVDNMHGEKVGHIKGTSAKPLAPIMDTADRLNVRIEATIPSKGNAYTQPLLLEFYSVVVASQSQSGSSNADNVVREASEAIAKVLSKALRMDYNFNLSSEFGGRGPSHSSNSMSSASMPSQPVVKTQSVKMNWQQQEKALDDMFDVQLENQMKDLPRVTMPNALKDITLFDFQIQGIKWLLKQETPSQDSMLPFYTKVKEDKRQKYLCEITQCSQERPPAPMKGSILCDEMGLGKTIQTLGLILLAPAPGVEYIVKSKNIEGADAGAEEEYIPIPPEATITSTKVAILKEICKAAKLKVSGKKGDLVNRILEGIANETITGKHFPPSMRPLPAVAATSSSANFSRCTLIVCPVSVMSNWQTQVEKHIHDDILSLRFYHGPNRLDILPEVQKGHVDILLVSYHTLAAEFGNKFGSVKGEGSNIGQPATKKSRKSSIFDIDFHRIVLDEAHTIRSTKTKFFKAVKSIRADRKLALTGTPFVNRADDVHSLLSFLGAEPLSDKTIFRRAIAQPIKNGDEIGLARLRTTMGCVSLRRSKTRVNINMVEKDVQLCSVEFQNNGHKKVYDALFGTIRYVMEAILGQSDGDSAALKNYTSVFERLMRLRQTCCSASLVSAERREVALKMWDDIQERNGTVKQKISAEEGLALLKKLKGAFIEEGLKDAKLPECGICLTEMEEQDCTILKSCSHVFCKMCIQQVLVRSNKLCPYCRKPFTQDDIIDKSAASEAASTEEEGLDNQDNSAELGTPPKVLALLDSIKKMQEDEKGVIFSQFTSFLDIVQEGLKEAGHSFVRLDGSVSAPKRVERIRSFNSDDVDSPRFILCSLHAAGTGINLTRGNHCFMLDCWWNSSIENQAMDRIHRLNQTRNVHVVRFVMKGSIEERIVALQEAKSMQAKGVLEKLKGDEKRKALLSDLRVLFSLDTEKK